MKIEYLSEFLTLVKTLNYLEAAEQLYISQSTLSKHIKTLENDWGAPLFDRSTRVVSLSQEGKVLLPYALRMVQACEQGRAALAELRRRHAEERVIRIASTSHMEEYGITDALARFKKKYDPVKLDVTVAAHHELKPLLLRHKVDFIWIGEPDEEMTDGIFERIPIHDERLVALMDRDWTAGCADMLDVNRLCEKEVFMQDNSSVEQSVFIRFCEKNGFTPDISSVAGTRMQMMAANANAGIPVMMQSLAAVRTDGHIVALPIRNSPLIHVNLVFLKKEHHNDMCRLFIDFIKSISK